MEGTCGIPNLPEFEDVSDIPPVSVTIPSTTGTHSNHLYYRSEVGNQSLYSPKFPHTELSNPGRNTHNHDFQSDSVPHKMSNCSLEEHNRSRNRQSSFDHHIGNHHNNKGSLHGSVFRSFDTDQFNVLLKELDDNIVNRDIMQLKFLCRKWIPGNEYEKITRAIHLFSILHKKQLILPDSLQILAELLYIIGRKDILKKIVSSLSDYECFRKQSTSYLSGYSVLLHEICEDTVKNDLKSMKFSLCSHFSKPKLDAVTEPEDLFIMMEKKELLGEGNLGLLLKIMKQSNREDMVAKIKVFNGSSHQGNPMSLNQWNSKNNVYMKDREHSASDDVPKIYDHPDYALLDKAKFAQGYLSNNVSSKKTAAYETLEHELSIEADLPCYKMDANPRGMCVIINNKTFFRDPRNPDSRVMKNREGSDVDKINLEYTFTKLNFIVNIHENLTAQKLVSVMNNYALGVEHSQYDCFVCCILTHGKKQSIYGCDGVQVEITQLTNFFKASICPTLRGKPKLFFIQACQGREKQEGFRPNLENLEIDGAPYSTQETIPNEADFLVAFATLPGFVSYRSRTSGSWFINALVENLNKYSKKEDLLSIMIKVNEEVAKMDALMKDGDYKQVPLPHPTLRKKIYFR